MSAVDILGLGNALVDFEYKVSDAFLQEQNLNKGEMTLIEGEQQDVLTAALSQSAEMVKRMCGGSAANTIVAASQLGLSCGYAAKLGKDEKGDFYLQDLAANGVTPFTLNPSKTGETGNCFVMVTPDAERTMNTFLGITGAFAIDDVPMDQVASAQWLYSEGYLVTSENAKQAVIEATAHARANGTKIAMTFSDPAMAHYFRDGLDEMLADGIDLLFANEEEALAFTGKTDLFSAIQVLQERAKIVVVTQGPKGCTVSHETNQIQVPTASVKAIDTNGAGDIFAGVFLANHIRGKHLKEAAEAANKAAAMIVQTYGARLGFESYKDLQIS